MAFSSSFARRAVHRVSGARRTRAPARGTGATRGSGGAAESDRRPPRKAPSPPAGAGRSALGGEKRRHRRAHRALRGGASTEARRLRRGPTIDCQFFERRAPASAGDVWRFRASTRPSSRRTTPHSAHRARRVFAACSRDPGPPARMSAHAALGAFVAPRVTIPSRARGLARSRSSTRSRVSASVPRAFLGGLGGKQRAKTRASKALTRRRWFPARARGRPSGTRSTPRSSRRASGRCFPRISSASARDATCWRSTRARAWSSRRARPAVRVVPVRRARPQRCAALRRLRGLHQGRPGA